MVLETAVLGDYFRCPHAGDVSGDGTGDLLWPILVIGLVIWGLNTFWLHRLKKGNMDYSPEGFRKRARIFAIILAAVLLGVPLLAALLLWNRH